MESTDQNPTPDTLPLPSSSNHQNPLTPEQVQLLLLRSDSTSPHPPPRPPRQQDLQSSSENPTQFRSALTYTEVHDFAYPAFHRLHYGVPEVCEPEPESEGEGESEAGPGLGSSYPEAFMRDGGPPWRQDPDLVSPVLLTHSINSIGGPEYEFSIASADEVHGKAIALFDFHTEQENEIPLKRGQIIWISYRREVGWLVAEDPTSGEIGLVPENYIQLVASTHSRTASQEPNIGIGSPSNIGRSNEENVAGPSRSHRVESMPEETMSEVTIAQPQPVASNRSSASGESSSPAPPPARSRKGKEVTARGKKNKPAFQESDKDEEVTPQENSKDEEIVPKENDDEVAPQENVSDKEATPEENAAVVKPEGSRKNRRTRRGRTRRRKGKGVRGVSTKEDGSVKSLSDAFKHA